MRAFKDGGIDLLVATTVIEVGVDVPNASLMIVENAERLGLAQLHQLRGRVGRGSGGVELRAAVPVAAVGDGAAAAGNDAQTNDGFVIAEKDLELRGPGELLGTRQTGLAAFRVADLARDADLLPVVQRIGAQLLARGARHRRQAGRALDRRRRAVRFGVKLASGARRQTSGLRLSLIPIH